MPQPDYPPFAAGSVTVPRQLIRWLDVNAQGGQLTRVQAFITVPSFNVTYTWRGYSDIVAAFNYEGPNNFSLTSLYGEIPSLATNYTMCIMWQDENNNVYRYSLIRGVGDNFYFTLTPYNGQPIYKNFRIEIWSTSGGVCSQTTSMNLYTTVQGQYDYRYANDFFLVTNDTVVTAFGNTPLASASTWPTGGLVAHWRADLNFNGLLWGDTVGFQLLTVSGTVTQNNTAYINGATYLDMSAGSMTGTGIINIPLTGPAIVILLGSRKTTSGIGTFFQLLDASSNVVSTWRAQGLPNWNMPNLTMVELTLLDMQLMD
jgi:hypothetical protein